MLSPIGGVLIAVFERGTIPPDGAGPPRMEPDPQMNLDLVTSSAAWARSVRRALSAGAMGTEAQRAELKKRWSYGPWACGAHVQRPGNGHAKLDRITRGTRNVCA